MRFSLKVFFLSPLVLFLWVNKVSALSYKSYKIGSYNLENFWDSEQYNTQKYWDFFIQSLPEDERTDVPKSPQYRDYSAAHSNWYEAWVLRKKIEQVIEAIKLAGTPDILALQELESANNHGSVFETRFSDRHSFRDKLKEMGYKYFLLGYQEPDNPVSVTTAFISKLKIKPLPSIKIKFPKHSTSARDIQLVELSMKNERLIIFNGHWKSKRGKIANKVE